MCARQNRLKEKGAALISVLWLSVVLTLLATTLTAQQRTQLDITQQRLLQLQARYNLEAAEQFALYRLLTDQSASPFESLSKAPNWSFNGMEIQITVLPESHKLGINDSGSPALSALFKALGQSSEQSDALADAIMDWRDRDDLPRLHGAERSQYQQAGLDYGPANEPFQHLSQLQQVLGMTPPLFQQLLEVVSLHSNAANLSPLLLERINQAPATEPNVATAAASQRSRELVWSIRNEAYSQGRFVSRLDSVQQKQSVLNKQPFSAVRWVIHHQPAPTLAADKTTYPQ